MRTIDPEIWCSKLRKRSLAGLVRPFRFRRQEPVGFEDRVRASFRDAWTEYWTHCSVRGLRCDPEEKAESRVRWCVVSITLAWGLLLVVHNCVVFRSSPPLLISLQTNHHPIANVHFPAIALCSNNVISKKALLNYTEYLYNLDNNFTYSRSEIFKQLVYFGGLIDMVEQKGFDEFFIDFLESLGEVNTSHILFKLAPSCSSMLLGCGWRGQAMACEELFAPRLTPLGYCCVFNSRYSDEDLTRPAKSLDMVGTQNGLSVIVREDSDDFMYVRTPVAGMEVLIFEGDELPLEHGGDLRRYLTTRNSSVFFSITVRVQEPAGGLATYSDDWRGCRMRWTRQQVANSWCVARCRVKAARALCACSLSLMHRDSKHQCTPTQLPCLNKHREKFLLYYPHGDQVDPDSLSEELEAGLDCSACQPDCTSVTYSAKVFYTPYLHFLKKLFPYDFMASSNLKDLTNVTVMRFYYDSSAQELYSVEGNLRWYELAASIGCQWLFLLGLSILCGSELVFHLTVRWAHYYLKHVRRNELRKIV